MISRLPNSAPTMPPIGVRGVHACRRVAPDPSRRARRRRAPAGSSRPRASPPGSTDPQAAHEIDLERGRRRRRQARADRPVRKHARSSSTRPTRSPPSAAAGRRRARARMLRPCARSTEPTLLPMPSPMRNAARMSENVYVVAPSSSDSRRVQTTSAASAVAPESAIVDVDRPRARRNERAAADIGRRARHPLGRRSDGVTRASARLRQRDDDIDRDGDVRRVRHVVHAQQIEAGEQAAEHRAGDVAAVEEAEPRHAFGRRLDPARDRRQRRAHEERRRQQAERAEQTAAGRCRSCRARRSRSTARRRTACPRTRAGRRRRSPPRASRRRAADAAAREMYFERNRLPMHMPPMNVPSSTPIETADEPMMRLRSWNQTIS